MSLPGALSEVVWPLRVSEFPPQKAYIKWHCWGGRGSTLAVPGWHAQTLRFSVGISLDFSTLEMICICLDVPTSNTSEQHKFLWPRKSFSQGGLKWGMFLPALALFKVQNPLQKLRLSLIAVSDRLVILWHCWEDAVLSNSWRSKGFSFSSNLWRLLRPWSCRHSHMCWDELSWSVPVWHIAGPHQWSRQCWPRGVQGSRVQMHCLCWFYNAERGLSPATAGKELFLGSPEPQEDIFCLWKDNRKLVEPITACWGRTHCR